MRAIPQRRVRSWAAGLFVTLAAILSPHATALHAAPYAAMVIDARTGEVLHSRNADTRLHPASLTKMMTLYVVFEAVAHGELTLDSTVRISRHAASEPPSKLGLKSGQRIALRYLVRAAAVKSANDAATALGEAVSGSEAAFAQRMTRTAKALGMTRTTFKNAHGLTQSGHLSSARDMTLLGRALFYDYPEYYNLFSRRSTDAGIRKVNNTNRRLLGAYKGADGIKTGYTRAAGFNLVASAERGRKRIIATVFGGRSTATRNARVAELLDMGFRRAPARAAVVRPARPVYGGSGAAQAAGPPARSPRPPRRPAMAGGIAFAALTPDVTRQAVTTALTDVAGTDATVEAEALEVVTRASSSGSRHYGISLGLYGSRHQAESVLLKTALVELTTLEEALRKVNPRSKGYEAAFVGMTRDGAALACARLAARDVPCEPLGTR